MAAAGCEPSQHLMLLRGVESALVPPGAPVLESAGPGPCQDALGRRSGTRRGIALGIRAANARNVAVLRRRAGHRALDGRPNRRLERVLRAALGAGIRESGREDFRGPALRAL